MSCIHATAHQLMLCLPQCRNVTEQQYPICLNYCCHVTHKKVAFRLSQHSNEYPVCHHTIQLMSCMSQNYNWCPGFKSTAMNMWNLEVCFVVDFDLIFCLSFFPSFFFLHAVQICEWLSCMLQHNNQWFSGTFRNFVYHLTLIIFLYSGP